MHNKLQLFKNKLKKFQKKSALSKNIFTTNNKFHGHKLTKIKKCGREN